MVALVLSATLLPAADDAPKPIWSTDLRAALAEQPPRPIVILMSTASCHWCDVLKQDAADTPALRQALGQTAAIEIDGNRHPDLAARWGVRGYPTLLLVNRRREMVQRIIGYQAPGDLAVSINVLVLHGDEVKERAEQLSFAAAPTAAVLLAAEDPAAALAAALDAADPENRRMLRDTLAKQAAAVPVLWQLLDHARPGVRVDAAAALAAKVGNPPDYDPLRPTKERKAAIARWQAEVTRREEEK